ncbi:hypothetical protein DFJ58DRAFT_847551 [Suillus subalutaceus]|uniref:uncharacterized protein n=1 Tax=Suillus subalutaceus TaxID=48586 RepID=UPI001B86E0F6|nr:uncharacterized protein DFJ58DRAFT_847551 [Suillus subalutaceus]KAG1834657.1 hypothetical protein DFJ58DRAFT_847551 [Suillus subalutaceus]
MQLNNTLAATAKHVVKMTGKAKAALEEKASSKKQAVVHTEEEEGEEGEEENVTPPPGVNRRAVVHTEEEENVLHEYIDLDHNGPVDDVNEDPEDKLKRLMKEWNSPVYAFFQPTPQIFEVADRCAHEFKRQAKGCKVKVRHFLDKGDARSTGNMRKHVRLCWGDKVLKAADSAKDAREVHNKIVDSIL